MAKGDAITGFVPFGPSRDGGTDPRVTGEVFAIYADPVAGESDRCLDGACPGSTPARCQCYRGKGKQNGEQDEL